jgi:hypothetical protein
VGRIAHDALLTEGIAMHDLRMRTRFDPGESL